MPYHTFTLPEEKTLRVVIRGIARAKKSWKIWISNLPKRPGRSSSSDSSLAFNRILDDLRYDGRNHLLDYVLNNNRKRYAGEGCSSHT